MTTSLKGRTVLVTGATGFIGARLIKLLIDEHGAKVTAAVRDPDRASKIRALGARIERLDLNKKNRVAQIVAGHDTVFHVAHDFNRSARYNLRIFDHLADACALHRVRRLVFVSSIAVYDNWPVGDFTESDSSSQQGHKYKNAKMAIEQELRRRVRTEGLDAIIIQPTIVYGPESSMWTDRIVEQLQTGTVVLPDKGQGLCNAVYVEDVARAMVLAATCSGQAGEAFIVSAAEPVTWGDLFQSYAAALSADAIDYVEYSELSTETQGFTGRLKGVIKNPLSIAGWWPVQFVLNGLRSLIGEKAIEGLRVRFLASRGPGQSVTYYPSEGDLILYRRTGRCFIDKARDGLGFVPAFDFAAGSRETAAYIKARYLPQP